jgi:hypothetical protein|tara:strand:+ start:219 stop:422 length:204 start_codon:yes stop_codon:yes gene_type:complete
MTEKQKAVDSLWSKYRKSLQMLHDALQENDALREQLSLAQIDLSTPSDIATLEQQIEDRLAKDGQQV